MDGCEIRHLGPERYSDEIVASMLAALQHEMRHAGASRAVLIGYSGGGTLAMLLAARLPAAVALVTLAGNLDNGTLAAFHHSPALSGSLDPADLPPLPRNLLQLHLFGEKDAEVPVSLAQNTLARQRVKPVIMRGFDHACCWEDLWPEINARLQISLRPNATVSGSKAG
jgi:dienelactone hydrolase